MKDALARNVRREGKACVPALGVVLRSAKILQRPDVREGLDELHRVQVTDGEFVVSDFVADSA